MHRSTLTLVTALSALSGSAWAQYATFGNTSFIAPATVGQIWPISFTAGDGSPVSIAFGNSTWAFTVVDAIAAPGTYMWNVAVPVGTVQGRYQLALTQSGSTEYSPLFDLVIPSTASLVTSSMPTATISFPAEPSTTVTVTAIYLPTSTPAATVTWIYWEERCGCHRTSSCAADDMPAPTAMSSTIVTYWDHEGCGCSKTVEASCAPTAMPMPMSMPAPASNWTAPPTNTPVAPASSPAAPVAPAYTGAAMRHGFAGLGMLVASVFAVVVV